MEKELSSGIWGRESTLSKRGKSVMCWDGSAQGRKTLTGTQKQSEVGAGGRSEAGRENLFLRVPE